MSSSNQNRENPQRGHFRGNPRGGAARGENYSTKNQPIGAGPQDGGFDTSSWGNHSNYYPVEVKRTSPTRQNEPRPRFQGKTSNFEICENYFPLDQVQREIEEKKTIRGTLRINAKQYTDAFVTDPDGGDDFFIEGIRDRNRALNSDEVAIQIKPKSQWKIIPQFSSALKNFIRENFGKDLTLNRSNEASARKRNTIENLFVEKENFSEEFLGKIPQEFFQRTAKVVFLFHRRHSMKAAGFLKKMPDNNPNSALFSPTDNRIPRLIIPMDQCPKDFFHRPDDFEKTLFVARIIDVPADKTFSPGELIDDLGDRETLSAQSRAILIENDVNDKEFSDEILRTLPEEENWKIPDEQIEKRLDLRNFCVFTIDPATARDLDDALSCEQLENGLFRVGVHIADVSFFVDENTPLDLEASQRTTSVYLVERVIPMLPRVLCDRLCSLNPGQDRLTFSVIWTMNENAEIIDEKFTRSIIRSCAKLSYDHAQSLMENPNKIFSVDEMAKIENNFQIEEIHQVVLRLFELSKKLRSRRPGALSLNQPKLEFRMKSDDRSTIGFSVSQKKESHQLVEEFMLLANTRVAQHLSKVESIREKSIFRSHPTPNKSNINKTIQQLQTMSIPVKFDDLRNFNETLKKIDDESKKRILVHLLAKSMKLAVYCCASASPDQDLSHFALNVDFYTHFTSPIRRYPDILVHRSLAASLGYTKNLCQTPEELQKIAQLCNEKKTNAKSCSERSSELHLAFFLKESGGITEEATISAVNDQSFDVYVFRIGFALRIGINDLPLDHPRTNFVAGSSESRRELTIFWKIDDPPSDFKQILRSGENVSIDLTGEFDKNHKTYKISGRLRNPKDEKPINSFDYSMKGSQMENIIQQIQDFDPYADF